MNFFQAFYDSNGKLIFDPTLYGDDIRIDNSGGSIKFYNSNNVLLFDTKDNDYYTANHETLFSSNNFSASFTNEKSRNLPGLDAFSAAEKISNFTNNEYVQNENRFSAKNKSWDAYIPHTDSNISAINEDTKLVAYFHETGNSGITPELYDSIEGTNNACIAPNDWRNKYFAGAESNIQTELGIQQDNVLFVGASKGGDYALNAFGDYIMDNPDVKNPKCLLVENTSMALNQNFTAEKKDAIRATNASIFVVGRSGPTGNFYNNTKLLYGNESDVDSNIRIFSVDLNYQRNLDSGTAHGTSLDVGLSSKLGLVNLLNGDDTAFREMLDEYNEYGEICYKYATDSDGKLVRTNYTYKPEFTLRYKGQVIVFNTPQEFLEYYNALQVVESDSSANFKLEPLKLIHSIEGTIVNSPEIVHEYMSNFRTEINKIEAISLGSFSDPVGISAAINTAVKAYNNCTSSFKESFNNYIDFGLDISTSYENVDEELSADAMDNLEG